MNVDGINSKDPSSQAREFNPDLTPAQFESQLWGRVLQRDPNYQDVLRRQAEALARAGNYAELLPLDRRLVELRPGDPVLYYNLTCTLARLQLADEALTSLKTALELGYDDFDHIESDPDLESLRDLPEYQALVAERPPRE